MNYHCLKTKDASWYKTLTKKSMHTSSISFFPMTISLPSLLKVDFMDFRFISQLVANNSLHIVVYLLPFLLCWDHIIFHVFLMFSKSRTLIESSLFFCYKCMSWIAFWILPWVASNSFLTSFSWVVKLVALRL
jgi:hypothetical protein